MHVPKLTAQHARLAVLAGLDQPGYCLGIAWLGASWMIPLCMLRVIYLMLQQCTWPSPTARRADGPPPVLKSHRTYIEQERS